jgi:hypothetical protein
MTMVAIGPRAARQALAGARGAHGGAARCPLCHCGCSGRAGEGELELELEINPVGPVHPEMLMEHLGHAAAETESEAEAEAFIGALVPLAAQVLPRSASAIMRVAPQLIRGAVGVGRMLRRDPRTRPLVGTLPVIVRRTAADVARDAARGRPVTPQRAVRTLARQTARTLGDPSQRARAQQRAHRLDRRFHLAACPRSYAPGTPDPLLDRGRLRPLDLSGNPLIPAGRPA